MTDRTVSVELLAKISGYTAGTDAAAASTNRLAAAMDRAGTSLTGFQRRQVEQASAQKKTFDALTTVGKGFLTLGVVAGVGFGLAEKAALNFNKQMALVGTLAQASPAQLKVLSNAALTVGQRFGYTATQVAQAEAELIKAGLSTSQVLGGALTGALTLAAAAQTDVATATEITVSAMTQFGLQASSVPHIADLLAAGADKALGSAVDLGDALNHVGTTAHQFGFSLDETVAVLASFANAGQIGQRAGTELNTALALLVRPSKAGAVLMQRYGFSIYDAAGNVKSFAAIADNLQTSFKGLSKEQRNSALATLFGTKSIQAANILYAEGAKGVQLWLGRVEAAGFATQQAAGKLDSLSGDLTKLKAAFETGLIKTGDEASSSLRGLVQDLTALVTWFDNLSPTARTVALDIAGVTAGIGLVGGSALIAVPKVVALTAAVKTLKTQLLGTTAAADAEAAAESRVGNAALGGAAKAGAGGATAGALARFGIGVGGGAATGLGAAAGVAGVIGGAGLGALALTALINQHEANRVNTKADEITAGGPQALAQTRAQLASLNVQIKALGQNEAKAAVEGGVSRSAAMGGAAAYRSLAGQAAFLSAAIAEATKNTKSATQTLADARKAGDNLQGTLSGVGTAARLSSFDVTTFSKDLQGLTSHFLGEQSAQDAVTEGFRALAKQAKTAGTAVTGNSAAALSNRDALTELTNKSVVQIATYAAQGRTADQVAAKTAAVKKRFLELAAQAGFSATKVGAYTKVLDAVRAEIRTNTIVTGVPKAIADILRVVAAAREASAHAIRIQTIFEPTTLPGIGVLAPPKKPARGGHVTGAGTGTSDSIPAMISNGEFVVNARATAAYLPLLERINSSIPAFARGGLSAGIHTFATGGLAGPNLSDIFSQLATTNAKGKSITSTLGAQFSTAVGRTTKVDGAFIANLDTLAAKGFGFLAIQLLESGDPNAKTLASQAVKWSSSHLRVVQAGLERSAAEQKQLGLLPAELAISSALRTGKSPTLSSIAAATGLDASDLQAGLIAMQKSLRGNKNAAALLSGLNSTGVYSQSSWGQTSANTGPQFQITVESSGKNPYSTGEKVALGAQRVLALSTGNQTLPRW